MIYKYPLKNGVDVMTVEPFDYQHHQAEERINDLHISVEEYDDGKFIVNIVDSKTGIIKKIFSNAELKLYKDKETGNYKYVKR